MKVGPKFYLIPKQTAGRQRITMEIMKVSQFLLQFSLKSLIMVAPKDLRKV